VAATAVIAALVLLPGAGAALAFGAPGSVSIESRIALAFGLGYTLVAGTATLLALVHLLVLPAFVLGVVLVAALAWILALRRAPPRRHASALAAQAREEPYVLAAGLAVLLAIAATRPLSPVETSLAVRSSWRYWADGLELAAAGHVPAETSQWGLEIPTTVSKVALNAFEGGVSFLLGADPLAPMHGILVVTTVGLAAALLALGRELGLSVFAPLVPALVVLTSSKLPLSHAIASDVPYYKAENLGRMVAFAALVAGIHAVRSRSRAGALVTGGVFAVAGLTHLVPALVAGTILLLYGAASIILARGGLRSVLGTGAVVAAVSATGYVVVIGSSGGDLGFQRVTGEGSSSIPASGEDPSLSFLNGEVTPKLARDGHFLISPRTLVGRYWAQTSSRMSGVGPALLGVAVLALASVFMVVAMRALFPLVLIAWGLVTVILAVAVLFSFLYDTVVPGGWGARRLYSYSGLVPALLVPGLLEALTSVWVGRRRLVVAALSLLAGLAGVVAALDRFPRDRPPASAQRGLAAIDRVAESVPCDARILANAFTAGTWEALSGRPAVSEGHAPYLRGDVLHRVLPVVIGASEFFADPVAHRSFLVQHGVEYVVVVQPGVRVGDGKPRRAHPDDARTIAMLPGLEPIKRDRRVSIFSVPPHGERPVDRQPERCPL
jgi:hypothetical protein